MRVIVCGSREFPHPEMVEQRIERLRSASRITVVHGAARGPDRIAAAAANLCGMKVEAHPADWDRHGKGAGYIRNAEMAISGADLCIAFWDGESRGTAHMIRMAESHGIPVEIIRPE